ncbi:Hypothetical predicted protein [Lecanosticta acicola]|uniref:Uncharacterized protein n=1 Tax=Lecanosticta acicola TaxID=111012 RepID=A0AAI8YRJ0_9PEZI|nr:Hypothetical predicted protein [Lecanosticta acicola]
MQKTFKNVTKKAVEGNNYTKFTHPKKQMGVRYDYDGEVKKDGVDCHKYNLQPNAGDDIPSSIKRWRKDNGGTHEVMAVVYVKKDGTKDDVEKALHDAHKNVKG